LDDLGLTVGPSLAAVALAVVAPSTLMGANAITYLISALLIGTLVRSALAPEAREVTRPRLSLLSEARRGIQSVLEQPEVRTLLACSTGVVLCVGVTNVGEVVLAREIL